MLRIYFLSAHQRKIVQWAIVFMLIFLASSFVMVLCSWGILSKPVSAKAGTMTIISVKPGMSAQDIGQELYDKGLIRNLTIFRLASKIDRLDSSLKAGDYSLHTGMSVNEIISIISSGETTFQQFTIPEGFTVEQIAALLDEKNIANGDKFKELAKNYAPFSYMDNDLDTLNTETEENSKLKYKAEGFLFPDTYRIAAGVEEEELLAMLVGQFDISFTLQMRQRADELGLSWHDVVTIASLVEKEALLTEEQPIIAAVFLKRLKIDFPLQSCATIQYILGNPKAELTVEDTQIPSPYNTYQNLGLPPGPIANPGKAAIEAVLQNQETDHLYFVADATGRHHFSSTYEEHLLKIAQVEAGLFDEKDAESASEKESETELETESESESEKGQENDIK